MNSSLRTAFAPALLALSLSACAASPPVAPPVSTDEQRTDAPAGACDASPLGWAIGQVADDALVERARKEAGAALVRVLRPGMMVTREFNATRLNIRVDNEHKVLATSCG